MIKGVPVVIAENGIGMPVRAVEKHAPLLTVAANGIGIPIVLSDLGVPYIVQGGSFSPAILFANGEQGVYFDPSDLDTLFQDAAGTTPVTAPGQVNGLTLDKSKGLELGPELVKNVASPSKHDGWASVSNATATISGNMVIVTSTSAGGVGVEQAFATSIGKFYQITFTTQSDYTGGSVRIGMDNRLPSYFGEVITSTPKTYSQLVLATSVKMGAYLRLGASEAGESASLTISVRELPGHHATQPDAAKRPTYMSAGGLHWLESDLVDDTLTATIPNLGTDATLAYATDAGTTILTGQTIGAGSFEVLRGEKTYAVLAVDRALTGPETTGLTALLDAARGA